MDPIEKAAPGSVGLAATYLVVSVIGLFAALAMEAWDPAIGGGGTMVALFFIWLSATMFTLGILEYRRSQAPPGTYIGPDV